MESKTTKMWDKVLENQSPAYLELFNFEETLLKDIANKCFDRGKYLDLGCGSGRTLANAVINTNLEYCYGLDNDGDAISSANNRMEEECYKYCNYSIILEDAENIPFENNSIDLIFSGLTFSNLGSTRSRVLKEVARVLKDEGKLVFSAYSEHALNERLNQYKNIMSWWVYETDRKTGTVTASSLNLISEQFSLSQLEEILENSQFKIDKAHETSIAHILECSKS